MKKTCIIIVGPTAVGKTSVAIQLAQHFNTSIISADSRQCFRELNIGVAKPSAEELATVKHYFINSHSIHEDVNAAVYERYALDPIQNIFLENDTAVLVGGTGLYVKAFCQGLDEVPAVDPAIRQEIITDYEAKGLSWLQAEVQQNDPLFYEKGEIKNPQRLMRALEVKRSTGRSLFSFHGQAGVKRDFNIIKIGLNLPREQLYAQINQRVDMMMEAGLLDEVRALLPFKDLNALQTVAYRELFDQLAGHLSLPAAVELIKTNTRHYAKRQLTWFNRDEAISWSAPDFTAVMTAIKNAPQYPKA